MITTAMKTTLLSVCMLALVPALAVDVAPGSYERLVQTLTGKGDVLKRTVERIGDNTIQIRILISADADYPSAKRIFGTHRLYREWALKNINVRSNGSSYLVKFLGCDPMENGVLTFPIRVDLPVFGRDLTAYIGVTTEEVQKGFVVHAKTTNDKPPGNPTAQALGTIDGYLYLFPSPKDPKRLFGELLGNLQFSNAFLYQALPERLLMRETSERIQTLLENYRDREMQRQRIPANRAK